MPKSILFFALFLLMQFNLSAQTRRVVLSLDGQWGVEEGVGSDAIPGSFPHSVPVPGLTHQAKPAFPDVDHYETRSYIISMIDYGVLPKTTEVPLKGITRQKRNYFWYQKTFKLSHRKQLATLLVNKAQFGTAVWLNGKKIGEHIGCFTAGKFNLIEAINWKGENTLVIRIGAHPGVMPDWAPWGTDAEKQPWTPGIYDNVSLILTDNPAIESVQVAPLISSSEIIVQTVLKNSGPACITELVQQVKTWKSQVTAGNPVILRVPLAAGEEKTVTQTIPVPNATLWSPENPFLYTIQTSTNGDNCTTRFGMREFRFDTPTRRAYLNGKVIFLRGASITLHRFFGDPLCQGQPWDEEWVRRLLIDIPQKMHWNSFRICIGPAPQKWLDIADEAGLLIQWEFPIWFGEKSYTEKLYPLLPISWNKDELVRQFKEFMSDSWNHPSVAIWDASNETYWPFLGDELIPAVRGLDLSNRPWENSGYPPQGQDDPYEEHLYLIRYPQFRMVDLEGMFGNRQATSEGTGAWCWFTRSAHASMINEYDWLWLRRDGTPTVLSKSVYERLGLLSQTSTSSERFEQYAYILGGLTEFWRAYRQHAGVMYLAYLDADLANSFTCDNFRDVSKPELEPYFADYMSEAFKPLGVYINFWQPTLQAENVRRYRIMLVNDEHMPASGKLEVSWKLEDKSQEQLAVTRSFDIGPTGQMVYDINLTSPATPGKYLLLVRAFCDGKSWSPTVARRKIQIVIQPNAK